jgi:hypothetical protein
MADKTYLKSARAISLFSLLLLFSTTAHPKTIYVDDDGLADFNNIQAAIDDSNDGDTVIVAEGRYFENINFNGKNITLRSTDPNDPNVAAATIIDGDQNGSVVTFNSGEDANCVLNGFTITNGNAKHGGGIYCSGSQDPQPPPPPPPPSPPPPGIFSEQSSPEILSEANLTAPTITNCIISNNSADAGGGMYNDQSNPTLTNCIFIGNSAYYDGGGMNNFQSTPTLTNCTFSENSADNGGGTYNRNSSLTLTNCTFNENLTDYIGGGMFNYYSSLKLAGCIFNGNAGGGMYSNDSSLKLTGCIFNGNAGVGMESHSSSLKLTGGIFNGNTGGGMYNSNSSLILTNCNFNENTSAYYGGGMYNYYSSPKLTNCTFTDNSAIRDMYSGGNGTGGGMYNYHSSPILTNCAFSGNSAYDGGGMYNSYSSPILTKCTFTDNYTIGERSAGDGGGMYNYYSSPTLTNCAFSGNSALRGGGIRNLESNLILNNCTFTGNSASGNGAGIYNTDGITTLANCILWENMGRARNNTNESAQIYGQSIIVDYSCIHGWTGIFGGTGNVGADPCFVVPGYFEPNCIGGYYPYCTHDWIDGDYHLLPDSLCINAGDPNYIHEPNETDLDGKPRVMGGRIDMGAYEAPPPAEVRITPRTINLASKGNSITCYIRLVDTYDVADIDPNSVLLQGKIEAESVQIDEGKQVVTARFRYEQLQEILNPGEVELTISLRLTDGTLFRGTDVISVKGKKGRNPDKYAQAGEPNPADGAINVSIDADLSWTPAPEATSRDVYFGTGNPPPFIGNQTAITFDPGTMDYVTTYYWRIDEIKKWGTTTGDLWSFTTNGPPPPQPPPPPW